MKPSLSARTYVPFSPIRRLLFDSVRSTLVLALCALCLSEASVDAARPQRFHQDQVTEPVSGLLGSEIGDIAWSGRYLWVATENGLARLDPDQASGLLASDWVTFTELNGLGRGAISALDATGDIVWTATLFDTTIAGIGDHQVGNGLSFSVDGGDSWEHIPGSAIFDANKPVFSKGPTTDIDNACFGLSITGSSVWAAFFAGSTVHSPDMGRTWERVLPDGADEIIYQAEETAADSLQIMADSLRQVGGSAAEIARVLAGADSLRNQALLHRTFAVIAYEDTVWIGTAGGLTRSFDGGRTWKSIRARFAANGEPRTGLPRGNWGLAIERQLLPDGSSIIWAGMGTSGEGEINSISSSRDQGETWEVVGSAMVWDFAFTANRIWAAGEDGLLTSSDQGKIWEQVSVEDAFSREQLRGTFIGLESANGVLWAGAENGLGRSDDEGETWRVIKSPVKPLSLDSGEVIGEVIAPEWVDSVSTYAAPNPFAPGRDEQARIHFSLAQDARVTIQIYDFASRLVRTLIEEEPRQGQQNHGENWDGRDRDGDPVANGVYFYRIELDSGQQAFGKVVVLD